VTRTRPGSRLLAALALAAVVLTGCSDSPGCDDLDSLTEELEGTSPEDPEYNDLKTQVNQAEADCNRGNGGGY
jgi:outer membrane murein-binding lipoprotein Lpp